MVKTHCAALTLQLVLLNFKNFSFWPFLFSVLLSLSPALAVAQKAAPLKKTSSPEVESALKEFGLQNPAYGARLLYSTSSPMGRHRTYQLTWMGQPVADAVLKINALKNGAISTSISGEAQIKAGAPDSPARTGCSDCQWYWSNNRWQNVRVVDTLVEGENHRVFISEEGELIEKRLRTVYHRDTTTSVRVFLPDPITSSGTSYGSAFADKDDSLQSGLTAELKLVELDVRYDSASLTWQLKSDVAVASDFAAPAGDPPALASPYFLFDRNHQGFEFVNAFYHIGVFNQRVRQLGFDSLALYPLPFDAHGKSGADQSSFSATEIGKGQLEFGDGGVDDAEDADVVIHEYGHALVYSAAPETGIGAERAALEEGVCDFLAMVHSASFAGRLSDSIFEWDGHNEFWSGRKVSTSLSYPSSLTGDIYGDGLIFTSALADAAKVIVHDTVLALLLNSFYFYVNNMTLTDAARFMLQADTVMNEAANADLLKTVFCNRGLMPDCADTLPIDVPSNEPYLANAEEFAVNNVSLKVITNGLRIGEVHMLDLHGRAVFYEVLDGNVEVPVLNLTLPTLSNGIYFLHLYTNGGNFLFKLLMNRR